MQFDEKMKINYFLFFFVQGTDVDTTCAEYENGTALHIAAANLGVSAVRILLNFGADSNITDDLARKPLDCVPEMHTIGKERPKNVVVQLVCAYLLLAGFVVVGDVFFFILLDPNGVARK